MNELELCQREIRRLRSVAREKTARIEQLEELILKFCKGKLLKCNSVDCPYCLNGYCTDNEQGNACEE